MTVNDWIDRHISRKTAIIIALIAFFFSLLFAFGCAGRRAYSSTDQKSDPNVEWYSGSQYYGGRYHDLWCKRDSNGVTVCRFE
jgi:hypothetical protein